MFSPKNSKRLLKQWTLYATLKVKVLPLVRRAFLKIFQTIFNDLHSQQDDCDPQKKNPWQRKLADLSNLSEERRVGAG